MKVNLKTNLVVIILTIIYGLLIVTSLFIKDGSESGTYTLLFTLDIGLKTLFALLLFYLTRVLIAFNEKKSIVIAFIMYTFIQTIYLIDDIMPGLVFIGGYIFLLEMLTFLTVTYLFIQIFRIQNPHIGLSFRLFGVSIFILFLKEMIVPMIFRNSSFLENTNNLQFLDIIKSLTILFILKRVAEFLKNRDDQSLQVSLKL
ncbi:hypothetical protein [Mucilaginibacter flavidus]|uniref:hypothetical protein n=1 Tax=Mucilaginibacter flavidus TaxID=2949309 RepID=UPI0020923709|nr:hypothetical protein [Mucilaginibacter flavidus]MCO5949410.1 hypothetical protein [Mucilaginibacter flavidus]